jgi:hypothetical protein
MTDLARKLHKRWGKKYHDIRDWHVYNEQLVKRGEYLLDLDWVESWGEELARMNSGKVGAQYRFPKSLIELQAIWHAKQINYRMIMGMTRKLCKIGQLPAFNHYSTTNRRVNDLDYALAPPKGDNLAVFSDGTGLQAINGGEYLREKYGKKNRRWVQIIILGDPVTKEPVSYQVNLIPASESESAERQLNQLSSRGIAPAEFGGDGSFDDGRLWNYCERNNVRPVIKPDKNARTDSDSHLRNQNVIFRNNKGYKKWVETSGYGRRWPATEGIFSAIKRIFSEQIMARSEIGLVKEASAKIWAYQTIKRYAEA